MATSGAGASEGDITNRDEDTRLDSERIIDITDAEMTASARTDLETETESKGDDAVVESTSETVVESTTETVASDAQTHDTDTTNTERTSDTVVNTTETGEDSDDLKDDFVKVDAADLATENGHDTPSKEELKEELKEEEEEKPGFIDVLGNGSLTKKVLVEAQPEEESKPQQGAWLEVTYEVHIAGQEAVLESEVNRKICVHDMDIVQGIDFTVMLMKCTEKAEIFVASDKAYGTVGRSAINVPPNTDLTIILTLERICPTPEKDELIQIIERKKLRAKELFMAKEYEAAVYIYTRCLHHLDESDLGKSDIAMSIKSNLAQGFLNMQRYDLALQHAMGVVNNDPKNTKALLRLGKAYRNLGDLKRAERVLTKASELEPNNKSISNELNAVKTKSIKSLENQKKIYGRMFGLDKSDKAKKSEKEGNTQYYVAGAVVTAGIASLCYSLYKSLT